MTNFYQITPHIFRLERRWLGFSVCVWLIQNGGEWVLIDTGPPGANQLLTALDQIKIAPTHLVLTHGHFDHTGGLAEILERFRIPVWCHEAEADLIRGRTRYGSLNRSSLFYRTVAAVLPQPVFPDLELRFLQDGAVWNDLEIIHSPGHAPGHLALLHRLDRALLCADAFRFKPWGALPVWNCDPKQARRSQIKLAELDFDHLLPSHGAPILGNGGLKALRAIHKK